MKTYLKIDKAQKKMNPGEYKYCLKSKVYTNKEIIDLPHVYGVLKK